MDFYLIVFVLFHLMISHSVCPAMLRNKMNRYNEHMFYEIEAGLFNTFPRLIHVEFAIKTIYAKLNKINSRNLQQ